MSKLVDVIAEAIDEGFCGGYTVNIKKILSKLDECEVKIYREDKSQPLPIYSKEGDACMDVYATSIEYDPNNDRYIVHTGLHVELPEDYELEIRPRSSNTKTEWYIPNSPGTVDYGYRGEIIIVFKNRTNTNLINYLYNLEQALEPIKQKYVSTNKYIEDAQYVYQDVKTDNEFPYKVGDRICQLLVRRRERIIWNEVKSLDELSKTERGSGGFGHTGK